MEQAIPSIDVLANPVNGLEDMSGPVVMMGGVYMDLLGYGFRIDPEGWPRDGEVLGTGYELAAGSSAANIGQKLAELGLRGSILIAPIGSSERTGNTELSEDALEVNAVFNAIIRQRLERKHINPAFIEIPGVQTSISFNATANENGNLQLAIPTANQALEPAMVLSKLEEVLPDAGVLYLGGCFKLTRFARKLNGSDRNAFDEIIALANSTSTKLVVDHGRVPKDTTEEMIEAVKKIVLGATLYLPSRKEFCRLWGVEDKDIEAALRTLHKRAPGLTVVVKDGANGAFYLAHGEMLQVKPEEIPDEDVVDLSGAGDAFNAGLLKAIIDGLPLPDAIADGNGVARRKITTKAT